MDAYMQCMCMVSDTFTDVVEHIVIMWSELVHYLWSHNAQCLGHPHRQTWSLICGGDMEADYSLSTVILGAAWAPLDAGPGRSKGGFKPPLPFMYSGSIQWTIQPPA